MTVSVLSIIIYHKNVVVALPGGRMTFTDCLSQVRRKTIEDGFWAETTRNQIKRTACVGPVSAGYFGLSTAEFGL